MGRRSHLSNHHATLLFWTRWLRKGRSAPKGLGGVSALRTDTFAHIPQPTWRIEDQAATPNTKYWRGVCDRESWLHRRCPRNDWIGSQAILSASSDKRVFRGKSWHVHCSYLLCLTF